MGDLKIVLLITQVTLLTINLMILASQKAEGEEIIYQCLTVPISFSFSSPMRVLSECGNSQALVHSLPKKVTWIDCKRKDLLKKQEGYFYLVPSRNYATYEDNITT